MDEQARPVRTITLRHLAEINPPSPEFDALPADADVLFLPLETVWSDSRADQARRSRKYLLASGYTRFQAGDTVCPKVTPTFQAGRSMRAELVGAGTTELHVLRPRPGVDPRWITYAVRSKHFLEEGVTAFQGVAGLQRVPPEFVANFRVVDASFDEQRRIADFLDDRVARIDHIIAARLRQIGLMREADRAAIDRHLGSKRSEQMIRLGRIAYIQSGLTIDAGRAASGTEVTLPYLRVANVQAERVDLSELKQVTVPIEVAARSTLRAGDVLMTEGGDLDKLGRGAIWRGDVNPCLHQNHVFAVRTIPSYLSPEFLALYTRTSDARRHFESTGSRSTNLASTSSAKVLDLRVPFRSLGQQHEGVRAYEAESDWVTMGKSAIADQAGLLQEYKQSLITAAVTGELDVTTAGSGIPG